MPVRDSTPGTKAVVAAITTVAATYAYFLLFAQFGFLQALQLATNGEQEVIKPVLALMGVAGILGSVFAARIFTLLRGTRNLIAGFLLCALAAGTIAFGVSENFFYPVAILTGLGTGVVTVTLAALLREAAGNRLGWVIGLGTGSAYAFCNLPAIFNAAPATQSGLSTAIAMVGAFAASQMERHPSHKKVIELDYSRGGIALWVTLFFALVSLDSAAFYVVQHTPELKKATWTGTPRLEIIAAVHFGAAALAGLAFDRRWSGRIMSVAAAGLVAACGVICFFPQAAEGGASLYVAAVSVYSVGLVFYAAQSSRPSIAAIVYGIAGWVGSAAGIGLVEQHHVLPIWFIGIAGAVMFAALSLRCLFISKYLQRN